MEKNKHKKFQVAIDTGLDNETKDIITRYWNFNGTLFPERIGEIGKEYDRYYTELLQVIKATSKAIITDNCANCNAELLYEVKSQTKFLEYYNTSNNCESCQKIEDAVLAKERERKKQIYQDYRHSLLEKVIEDKAWKKLTLEENRLLLYFIESPIQDIWSGPFQSLEFKEKQVVIDKFVALGLIDRGSEFDFDDTDYGFSPKLPGKLKTYLNGIETKIKPDKHFSANWSRISFELKKNQRYLNRDTPMNSGTITFEEDVVIKAGTKCLYGVWGRENENAWLSITPVSDVIVSKNKSIDSESEPIKSILKRILHQ